ncbi:hypothetical protein SALBM217S_03577 [Streptomyces griseoloalbus]
MCSTAFLMSSWVWFTNCRCSNRATAACRRTFPASGFDMNSRTSPSAAASMSPRSRVCDSRGTASLYSAGSRFAAAAKTMRRTDSG